MVQQQVLVDPRDSESQSGRWDNLKDRLKKKSKGKQETILKNHIIIKLWNIVLEIFHIQNDALYFIC